MSSGNIHNPVTALSEADATGAVAEIFADIRSVMDIPMVTSIWRMLVDFDGALLPAWEAAKVVYQTGEPQAALLKIEKEAFFPAPEPIDASRLEAAGVSKDDFKIVLSLIDAYNRSNGLNLIALTALTVSPSGPLANAASPRLRQDWVPLPRLLNRQEISESTWNVLVNLHTLSDDSGSPGIATVWRHLARWPGLVELVYDGMAPLAREGKIEDAKSSVQAIALSEGERIAHLRPETVSIPLNALDFIASYAREVHHIVALCHGVSRWLRNVKYV